MTLLQAVRQTLGYTGAADAPPSTVVESMAAYDEGRNRAVPLAVVAYGLIDPVTGEPTEGGGGSGTTVTPGGTGTEIQFRSGTTFAGIPGSSWDGTTLTLPGITFGSTTVINGGTIKRSSTKNTAEVQQTLTDAATVTWDVDNGGYGVLTLGGNRTIANPTNTRNGATYILEVIQDATGSRTLTWGTNFAWSGGTAPTLTTTAGKRDIITFVCSGGKLYGTAVTNF